jgi:hypothetical protein
VECPCGLRVESAVTIVARSRSGRPVGPEITCPGSKHSREIPHCGGNTLPTADHCPNVIQYRMRTRTWDDPASLPIEAPVADQPDVRSCVSKQRERGGSRHVGFPFENGAKEVAVLHDSPRAMRAERCDLEHIF